MIAQGAMDDATGRPMQGHLVAINGQWLAFYLDQQPSTNLVRVAYSTDFAAWSLSGSIQVGENIQHGVDLAIATNQTRLELSVSESSSTHQHSHYTAMLQQSMQTPPAAFTSSLTTQLGGGFDGVATRVVSGTLIDVSSYAGNQGSATTYAWTAPMGMFGQPGATMGLPGTLSPTVAALGALDMAHAMLVVGVNDPPGFSLFAFSVATGQGAPSVGSKTLLFPGAQVALDPDAWAMATHPSGRVEIVRSTSGVFDETVHELGGSFAKGKGIPAPPMAPDAPAGIFLAIDGERAFLFCVGQPGGAILGVRRELDGTWGGWKTLVLPAMGKRGHLSGFDVAQNGKVGLVWMEGSTVMGALVDEP